MNMPALSAAINSRHSSHLAKMLSPNAPSAKVKCRRFIQMSELFSKDLVFIKLIQELLSHQQHPRRQHRRLQKMINRDGVDGRLQFPHHVLNRRLPVDQFHLA